MKRGGLFALVLQSISRNKRNFIMSAIGIVVGVSMFTFFVALGEGIREGVLNRIYPINQIEIEPRTVNVLGVKESLSDTPLTDARVQQFSGIEDVAAAFPKQRSKFQARLRGGRGLFGRDVHTEAFFDGIDPELVRAELEEGELGGEGRTSTRKKKRQLPCRRDNECGPGQECKQDVCVDIKYFELFRDFGESIPCDADSDCAPRAACLGGLCRERACESSESCGDEATCVPVSCESDTDCGEAEGACVDGRCGLGYCAQNCQGSDSPVPPRASCGPADWCVGSPCLADGDCDSGRCDEGRCTEGSVCEPIPCALGSSKQQLSGQPSLYRGRVPGLCADGTVPVGMTDKEFGTCELPLRCPDRTYCGPLSAATKVGTCQRPIPVIISPFLIDMFNAAAATALGLRRVSENHALLGLGFRIQYGDSFFTDDMAKSRQLIRRAEVVGVSDKALDLGVTMPIRYVERANARFAGRDAAGRYDSLILEAVSNEAVHQVTATIERMGFELGRKSEDAKKAGNMLYILTIVFAVISWIIMTIAAINISHTFLMVIYERKRELGVLRAVGATRGDIRKLVLGEAALVGLFGGAIGNLFAWSFSHGVDWLASKFLGDMSFLPERFFVFEPMAVVASMGLALLFCVVGAYFPSSRAAALDPAVVLSQP